MPHYWRIVEHWTAGRGVIRNLWLEHIDQAFTRGWRVEWSYAGKRQGQSFTGLEHDPAFEVQARELLAEKMADGDWQQVEPRS